MDTPRTLRLAAILLCGCAAASGQNAPAPSSVEVPATLSAVPFERLADRQISPDGRRALSIRPGEWKHSETPHFVLHYFRGSVAAPVAVEAEFFYRFITADLGIAPEVIAAAGGGKTHLYLFETRDDWVAFRKAAELEAWTGAVCIDGALFIPRYPECRFRSNALGHEIVHLLVNRYVGRRSPLWLKEGQAEEVSSRGYTAYLRARGYEESPLARIPRGYIPLARLVALSAYPPEPVEVETVYRQSRALVAFLCAGEDKARFLRMFRAMAQGAPFARTFPGAYAGRWDSLDTLETAFKRHMETAAGQ